MYCFTQKFKQYTQKSHLHRSFRSPRPQFHCEIYTLLREAIFTLLYPAHRAPRFHSNYTTGGRELSIPGGTADAIFPGTFFFPKNLEISPGLCYNYIQCNNQKGKCEIENCRHGQDAVIYEIRSGAYLGRRAQSLRERRVQLRCRLYGDKHPYRLAHGA